MADHCSCHHDAATALETSPSPVDAEQIVADVAGRRAGALEVMKQMGINHCCGAHLTLREAAAAAGGSLDALLAARNEPRKAPA